MKKYPTEIKSCVCCLYCKRVSSGAFKCKLTKKNISFENLFDGQGMSSTIFPEFCPLEDV
jgi:hypothetical protein